MRAEIASTPAVVEAVRVGLGVALVPLAGLCPPPAGTTTHKVDGVDLGLDVGIVRPRVGEPYCALTSQVLSTIRTSAPTWRSRRPVTSHQPQPKARWAAANRPSSR